MGKKRDDKLTELGYTIEALQDEVDHWQEVAAENKAKLWDIICENDRLTLTYEPYSPPGHEDENVGYYDLKEENKDLSDRINRYLDTIQKQDNLLWELRAEVALQKLTKEAKKKFAFKNDRWWSVSFELWPGAWDLNYYRYDWKRHNGTSREGNFQIGPLGFSWNRDPKR